MRRFAFLFLAALVSAGALLPRVRAQTNWTAVTSGTARNLWGVCYGGGQFVAVGEGGTILTSPDGLAWSPQISGTQVWLTSVAHGLGNFVVVGDAGTVLASRDGRVWAPATSWQSNPPANRLNVVRFTGSNFVAYGEHNAAIQILLPARIDWNSIPRDWNMGPWWRGFATGLDRNVIGGEAGLAVLETNNPYGVGIASVVSTAIRNVTGIVFDRGAFVAVGAAGAIVSSTDTTNWTPQPSGTTANLHGIAAFNNTLIAVGENGTVLSLDAHDQWARRSASTSELLLAVAASDTAAVVVGGSGTILRSAAAPMAPTIVSAPSSLSETLGGAASFAVRANGSLPLSYQWLHNGRPLAGETRSALTRTPLTAADAGVYTVTVSNPAGAVTSPAATLALLPAPAPIVDSSFHADNSLDSTPTGLLPLADNSLLVLNGQMHELIKLRADGSLAPSWPGNSFGPAELAFVSVLVSQPDGRILVGGDFSTHNSQSRPNLIRLNADGTFDSSFIPAVEATMRPIVGIAVQPDGRILIANRGLMPLRLLPDGQLDATFQPQPLPPEFPFPSTRRDWLAHAVADAGGGNVLVAYVVNLNTSLGQMGRAVSGVLQRLDGAGRIDPAFVPVTWRGNLSGMRALDDGGVLVLQQLADQPPFFVRPNVRVARFRNDGTPFVGHLAPVLTFPRSSHIYPDGRVLYFSDSQQGPIRLTPLGGIDPGFTGGIGEPLLMAPTSDGRVLVAGSFDLYNGKPVRRLARLNAVPNEASNPPRILSLIADKTTVSYGEATTVRATVTGSAELTYDWRGPIRPFADDTLRTTSPAVEIRFHSPSQSRTLRLTVRNPRGEAVSAPIVFTVLPDAPQIASQPIRVSAQAGRDLTLRVEKNDTAGGTEAEWRRDGRLLARTGEPWEDRQTLYLPRVTAAEAGSYTLTLRNVPGATVTTMPILLTIDDSSRFINLSTRATAGTGEQTLIAGFTVSGHRPRTVLVRGLGPALARFGVTDPLPDPEIQLFQSDGQLRGSSMNDDWHESSRPAFAALGAFPLDAGSRDAAFISTLEPGSYTVQLAGKPGQTGTALVEVYEYDNDAARMLNVSTRATIRPEAPAISGFVIQGPVPKRVLLRAIGPGLGGFGVSGWLPNPRITIKDERGTTTAANDDWGANANVGELTAATAAAGAFPLPTGSRDAALLATLPPGSYTMIVEGGAGESGVALLEAYEVP